VWSFVVEGLGGERQLLGQPFYYFSHRKEDQGVKLRKESEGICSKVFCYSIGPTANTLCSYWTVNRQTGSYFWPG
jgi:hypothetical protein